MFILLFGLLYRVDVASVAYISEVYQYAASIFRFSPNYTALQLRGM
jgi:hypothetical protein